MDVYIGTVIPWPLPSNKIPTGWHLCDGSLMQVAQNQALYAVIGQRYGGNGTTNFNLPDLRNRVAVGEFNPGASPAHTSSPAPINNTMLPPTLNGAISSAGGSVHLALTNLPAHTHTATFTPSGTPQATATVQIPCNTTSGSLTTPSGNYLGLANDPTAGTSPQLYQAAPVSGSATLAPFDITLNVPAPSGVVTNAATGGNSAVTFSATPATLKLPVPIPINPVITCNFIIAVQGYFPPHQ
ncbi:MAG: phage tail protein [Mucilaginibacter sp.]